ncbi:hypothetical protein GGS20DRAFT_558899 [Poronia punctata]|nr:hypothetical protein GGS20DRAFT_558899 [Poronia punctata]
MAPLIPPTLASQARNIISSAHSHAIQAGPLAIRALLFNNRADDDDNNSNNDNDNPKNKNQNPQLDPTIGVTDPQNINNTFIFVLFGLIGAAFVIGGIWFFFWAKNGGFYFREDDWDDYKSTVLRRRGPNGTILSGATESTDLGGGSVYKDVADNDNRTEYTAGLTEMSASDTVSTLTGITAGASDIAGRERRRRAREKKEREHEKRREKRRSEKEAKKKNSSSRRKVGEDGALVDEEAEEEAQRNLRAYRHERPARVGGLNKEFEGSEWDGSTNPEMSTMSGSEYLLAGKQATPTSTPTKEKEKEERSSRKAGGIRKVYSTADRTAMRENEHLRREAKRLAAERGRSTAAAAAAASSVTASSSAASSSSSAGGNGGGIRRDYSFQRAGGPSSKSHVGSAIYEEETDSMITASEREDRRTTSHHGRGYSQGRGKYLPAISSVGESDIGDGSDLGTKSYRHYIPGISSSNGAESADGGSAVGSDYVEEQRRKRGAQRYSRPAK